MRWLVLALLASSGVAFAQEEVPTPPAPAPAAAAPLPQISDNRLQLSGPIVFETAGDKLKGESDAPLAQVKAYLDAKDYITLLRIENHTDSTGDAALNQALSEKRALAVAKWLVAHGVSCKRLIPVGFGPNKPVAANDSAEGRAQNRRTEFINAALKDRPIGGMPVDGGGVVAGDPCQ